MNYLKCCISLSLYYMHVLVCYDDEPTCSNKLLFCSVMMFYWSSKFSKYVMGLVVSPLIPRLFLYSIYFLSNIIVWMTHETVITSLTINQLRRPMTNYYTHQNEKSSGRWHYTPRLEPYFNLNIAHWPREWGICPIVFVCCLFYSTCNSLVS